MLKSKIRNIAVTGITALAATLITLSATGASAATTTAISAGHPAATRTGSGPGHIIAPRAAEATGCVTELFTISDENTYEQCVAWEQVLLNDLYGIGELGPPPNQRLATDGYYGPDTAQDVVSLQAGWGDGVDGRTGPQTWGTLCGIDQLFGFTGVYWHDVGCASVVASPAAK